MKVHGEIVYKHEEDGATVHSDICPQDCEMDNMTEEHIKFLHDVLDEWLRKSKGTGFFYIGNTDELVKNFE